MSTRRCVSPHCVCCDAGADMTVERKPGLREALCRACFLRMQGRIAMTNLRAVAWPCACGAPVLRTQKEDAERQARIHEQSRRYYIQRRAAKGLPYLSREDRAEMRKRGERPRNKPRPTVNLGGDVTAQRIIAAVLDRYGLQSLAELRCRENTRRFVGPRGMASYLLRHECGYSLVAIGAFFGQQHTSAMYHIHRIEKLLPACKTLQLVHQQLLQAVRGEEVTAPDVLPVFDRKCAAITYVPGAGEWTLPVLRYAKRCALRGRVYRPKLAKFAAALGEIEKKKAAMPALIALVDMLQEARRA